MNPRIKKVIQEKIVCLENGHRFHTFSLTGNGYGDFLGRTPLSEFAEFNSWEDPVFDEVISIVDDLIPHLKATGEPFRQVLGKACDPSPLGHVYNFTGKIWCPICRSDKVEHTSVANPVFETIEVPQVTHEHWNKLSEEERTELIKDGLKEKGWIE